MQTTYHFIHAILQKLKINNSQPNFHQSNTSRQTLSTFSTAYILLCSYILFTIFDIETKYKITKFMI